MGCLGWEIDPKCLESKESYYYRSWDGSCNWLRKGQAATGAQDQAYARDYTPPHYKPGTSLLFAPVSKGPLLSCLVLVWCLVLCVRGTCGYIFGDAVSRIY